MIISVGKYAQVYGVYGIGLCLGMKQSLYGQPNVGM